jgi:hypothetical protein
MHGFTTSAFNEIRPEKIQSTGRQKSAIPDDIIQIDESHISPS